MSPSEVSSEKTIDSCPPTRPPSPVDEQRPASSEMCPAPAPHSSSQLLSLHATENYDFLLHRPDQGPTSIQSIINVRIHDTHFNARADLLSKHSCFFLNKINNYWRDDRVPTIDLSSQDVGAFHLFIRWINGESHFNDGATVNLDSYTFEMLFHSVILANNIQALPFQNAMLSAIGAKLMAGHLLEPTLPQLAYQNTPSGSPLRRIILDAYVRQGRAEMMLVPEAVPYLEREFLRDLAAALMTIRSPDVLASVRPYDRGDRFCSRYHNHNLEGGGICGGPPFTLEQPKPDETTAANDHHDIGTHFDTMSIHNADQTADTGGQATTPARRLFLCDRPATDGPVSYATPASTRKRSATTNIKQEQETPCPKRGRKDKGPGSSVSTPIELD